MIVSAHVRFSCEPDLGAQSCEPLKLRRVFAELATVQKSKSGKWAFTAGLPAKTGVGGGIVAVAPGKLAIVGFSPRVNTAGNSVRAALAIEYIAEQLGLNLFDGAR
jgi:glutaminase